MTQVLFTFVHPDGTPLADTEFSVQLRKAGLDPLGDSLVVPQTYTFVTNAQGTALLDLQPSTSVYTMVMARDGEQCGGIRYKFYVPHSDEVVNAEDLYLAPPPNSEPWDEVAIAKLAQAVQDVKDGGDAAQASANASAASATAANASKVAAGNSATAAAASQQAAATSATGAAGSAATATTKANESAASAAAALASKNAAAVSATGAAGSATEALASKNAAAASATASANSAADALVSKNAAAGSATAAAASASTATTKSSEASTSAATATTQAGTATTQAGIATTQANRAKTEADNAAAALSTKQDAHVNLTGLSALTSANDRFPYFTGGGGSMGLATLTAYARTLLARDNAIDARSTLGLGTGAITNIQTASKANTGELLRADLNGIGMQRDLRGTPYLTGLPRDLSFTGTTIGFGDAGVLGIPGFSAGTYGVLHSNIHFSDPSGAPAMSQTFEMHGETWRRIALSLDAWNTWLLVGGRTIYLSNADGDAWMYPDGSMMAVANLDGGTFAISTPLYRTWNYPRAFVGAAPKVLVSMSRPSLDVTMVTARTMTPTLSNVQMAHSQTSNAGCNFVCLAMGRWK